MLQGHSLLLTKIVATLGPVSSSVDMIRQLIFEGVRVFRVNFSYGTFKGFENLIDNIRAASDLTGTPVAVLGDLSGPKIRVGQVKEGGIMLEKGMEVRFIKKDIIAGMEMVEPITFSSTYPHFTEEVDPGQKILLDDGNVQLKCTHKTASGVTCEVVRGGRITSKKGINLPETKLSVPPLTEWDYQCVEFAVKKNVDYLALSFVRNGSDVRLLKEKLKALGSRPFEPIRYRDIDLNPGLDDDTFIPIISKIEKPQAIADLENIVHESDGIMIARGDLGVEMELAEVAVLQKRIINTCHNHGVPVIVATQMLQSMIESPVPTRAEVSDVANAIFDGVDAVMLSGETAIGKYPVETVRMMSRIARLTNEYILAEKIGHPIPKMMQESKYRNAALAHGVKSIVNDMDARLIIVWTKFGGGALYLSQLDITRSIIAFSDNHKTLNRLALLYGIQPEYMKQFTSLSDFIGQVNLMVIEKGWAKKGEPVVFVYGEPLQASGVTNSIYVHYLE